MVESWSGNWWALALRAAAAILLGLLAFAIPGITLAAIVLLFGVYAIVDGIFALVAAVRGIRRHERWGGMMLEGIAGLIAGVIVLFWPAIGALTLAFIIAGWALVTGVLEITAAVQLRKVIKGEWMLLLAGVLSIALGILVAFFPAAGVVLLVWLVGAYALADGVVMLTLATRLRRWTKAQP
ncbi:MAG: HdeD family acid-resistance protein [Gemmatimonadetes bacterium]|nr:HdeD family acid-resistance protein [Gemmatimonadota bacterium]